MSDRDLAADSYAAAIATVVFAILAGIAVLFLLFAVRNFIRAVRARDAQLTVVACRTTAEVKKVKGRRRDFDAIVFNSGVTFREQGREDQPLQQQFESYAGPDEFATLDFATRFQPGSVHTAAILATPPGVVSLEPEKRWLEAYGPLFGVWMFGAFAWLLHPMTRFGGDDGGMGTVVKKILFLGALIPISVLFGAVQSSGLGWAGSYHRFVEFVKKRGDIPPLRRVPVEAYSKTATAAELIAEARALGVIIPNEEKLAAYIGEIRRFCEYDYYNKRYRTTSTWCQPPQGESCPGRLNPANPKDVKWGNEPD